VRERERESGWFRNSREKKDFNFLLLLLLLLPLWASSWILITFFGFIEVAFTLYFRDTSVEIFYVGKYFYIIILVIYQLGALID
jgi:uncharacterized membrane protein